MPDISILRVRKELIDHIIDKRNVARKMESKRKWDFYKNKHKPYVYASMCEDLSREAVEEQRQIFSINLTKKIVDGFASIYKKEPKRIFSEASDAEREHAENLYEKARVNEKLKFANKMYKTLDQITIQVLPRKGKLILRPLPPHMYDVIPDPFCPEEPHIYILSSGYREDDKREHMTFVWWSQEYNFKTDGDGNILSEDGLGRNPIGRLPFVDVAAEKEFDYWIDAGCTIVDFAEDFMKIISDVANIVRLQGFSQAVIYAEKVPEKLLVGSSQLLHLPLNEDSKKDPKFEFVTPSPDLGNTLMFVSQMLNLFLTSQGVDPTSITTNGQGKTFSSGLERLLSMIETFEASRDDIEIFMMVEREIFELIKSWNNILQNTGVLNDECRGPSISDRVYVQVEHETPEMIQTKKDRIEDACKQLDKGLMSRAEAISEIRQIDIEEANRLIEELDESQRRTEEEVIEVGS